jgi:hypothetical protein
MPSGSFPGYSPGREEPEGALAEATEDPLPDLAVAGVLLGRFESDVCLDYARWTQRPLVASRLSTDSAALKPGLGRPLSVSD